MSLQREITLSIKIGNVDRNYKVKFPTVGQYIQVQSRQAELATPITSQSTQYLNMIMKGTIASNTALDMVDMIAWFEICIPDLMKDTIGDIKSIEDLDIFDVKPLLEAYKNIFLPWKESWEKIFYGVNDEEKKEDNEVENKK